MKNKKIKFDLESFSISKILKQVEKNLDKKKSKKNLNK